MSFKVLSYVMTLAGGVLGMRFIFAGAGLLKDWGLDPSDGSLVICRRLGAVYLGLALMFFLGRDAGPSELRSALCLGVGGMSALLAGLGFFERSAGRVSSGIVVPTIVEVALAAGCVVAWWLGR